MTNTLIIFDLDGVLIESRELHYDSLNRALHEIGEPYVISRADHLSLYDGLSTSRKLDLLTARKGLPQAAHDDIWQRKQRATFDLIKRFPSDPRAIATFAALRARGWKIAVASNSIRETVKLALLALGLMEYVDYVVSNQDVRRSKPYPDMYWQCMSALDALPATTIIVEDSHIGRQGAVDSGCHLLAVENAGDWDQARIFAAVDQMEDNAAGRKPIPWRDKTLNVLIPMAGAGSRFAAQGYTFPKPLIEVRHKPMIQVVVENLNIAANYIFIVQQAHYHQYNLKYLLNLIAPDCKIVLVDGVTEGAACTSLLAKHLIDNEQPLVIANSDQYVEWNANECLYAFKADQIDGGILTFAASHPKWSYAKLGDDGFVCEVAEKKVISNHATVGIYYWAHGADYVRYAEQMIAADLRVNNEFYIAPVYNLAIADGKKIRLKPITAMHGIGTPEDLNTFLAEFQGRPL
jgi:HAD superfamily hydrolase (TIGR01509 family)